MANNKKRVSLKFVGGDRVLTTIQDNVQRAIDSVVEQASENSHQLKTLLLGGTNTFPIVRLNNEDRFVDVAMATSSSAGSGSYAFVLPATPKDGQQHTIKDTLGTTGQWPIFLIPGNTSGTIDKQRSLVMSQSFAAATVKWHPIFSWQLLSTANITASVDIPEPTTQTFFGSGSVSITSASNDVTVYAGEWRRLVITGTYYFKPPANVNSITVGGCGGGGGGGGGAGGASAGTQAGGGGGGGGGARWSVHQVAVTPLVFYTASIGAGGAAGTAGTAGNNGGEGGDGGNTTLTDATGSVVLCFFGGGRGRRGKTDGTNSNGGAPSNNTSFDMITGSYALGMGGGGGFGGNSTEGDPGGFQGGSEAMRPHNLTSARGDKGTASATRGGGGGGGPGGWSSQAVLPQVNSNGGNGTNGNNAGNANSASTPAAPNANTGMGGGGGGGGGAASGTGGSGGAGRAGATGLMVIEWFS